MAAAALRAQLNAHIASMYATGSVDAYFQQLQSMDEGSATTGFVAEVINIFLNDADRILNDIAGLLSVTPPLPPPPLVLLNQPEVDFYKVDALVHQLIGSSSTYDDDKPFFSILALFLTACLFLLCIDVIQMRLSCWLCVGAKKVKLACMQFRQSYVAKSKERCLMALALLRNEFCDVRNQLQIMMQMYGVDLKAGAADCGLESYVEVIKVIREKPHVIPGMMWYMYL
uniref:Histidine-containing phosphotransfer protein n=1 Tax=Aegilops tauschii TaxID=37682 RepID=N1R582_AEGTA